MSAYIIPGLVVALLVYATIKKHNAYNSFVFGAKTSFDLVLTSFPYVVAILVALELFNVSGLSLIVSNFLSPAFSFVGIPKELTHLIVVKPFSGGGSLAILEGVFETYGVDSYIARAGSVVAGSSEAVFYVAAVYFAKTDIKNTSMAVFVSLFINIATAIFACFLVRFI